MNQIKRNNTKKKDIANNIHINYGIPLSVADKLIDDLISIMINHLYINQSIKIKNFGRFNILNKNERFGRNPKTKKEYTISKRRSVTFKGSDHILNKLNKDLEI